jgi:hypothetical protein
VRVKNQGLQANIDWKVGGLELTSITAYTNVKRLQQEDADMNPFLMPPYTPPPIPPEQNRSFIAPSFEAETDTYSQEFRVAGELERMRWLAGVYYFDNEVDGHYQLNTDAIGFVQMDAQYTQDTDSLDLFGQVEYDLAESWTVIAGLRWTDEEKTLDFENIDNSGITAFCSTEPDADCIRLHQPRSHADQSLAADSRSHDPVQHRLGRQPCQAGRRLHHRPPAAELAGHG